MRLSDKTKIRPLMMGFKGTDSKFTTFSTRLTYSTDTRTALKKGKVLSDAFPEIQTCFVDVLDAIRI